MTQSYYHFLTYLGSQASGDEKKSLLRFSFPIARWSSGS